jgi:hypothetical protein
MLFSYFYFLALLIKLSIKVCLSKLSSNIKLSLGALLNFNSLVKGPINGRHALFRAEIKFSELFIPPSVDIYTEALLRLGEILTSVTKIEVLSIIGL